MPARARVGSNLATLAFMSLVLLAAAWGARDGCAASSTPAASSEKAKHVIAEADTAGLSRAIFAGGCFWCEETAFESVPGVRAVVSGYVGGEEADPSYDDVSWGRTGHAEAVLVSFDSSLVSYEKLLEIFWVNHDPTTNDRQFCDRGRRYRPGIFYLDGEQKRLAEASVAWAKERARFDEPILTEITPATPFWPAQEHQQDFWRKDPARYESYRLGCGRDARLAELWGGGGDSPIDAGLPSADDYAVAEVPPVPISTRPPEYPKIARQSGVQGTVTLRVLVDKEGDVRDVVFVDGPKMLKDAAIAAVKLWKFRPALVEQRPVAVWVMIPMKFEISHH